MLCRGQSRGLPYLAPGALSGRLSTHTARTLVVPPFRSLLSFRSFSGSHPPPGSIHYRPSWGVRLFALTVAGTSTFYFSQSGIPCVLLIIYLLLKLLLITTNYQIPYISLAWLNGLGDEPCYHLDRLHNDKKSVVFSEDYDQNWWGLERYGPGSPLAAS
jgi:hypothetical protein